MTFGRFTSIVQDGVERQVLVEKLPDMYTVRRILLQCAEMLPAYAKIENDIVTHEGYYEPPIYAGPGVAIPLYVRLGISIGNRLQVFLTTVKGIVIAVSGLVNYNNSLSQYTDFTVDLSSAFGLPTTELAAGTIAITPNATAGTGLFTITQAPNTQLAEYGATGTVDVAVPNVATQTIADGTTAPAAQVTNIETFATPVKIGDSVPLPDTTVLAVSTVTLTTQ